MWAVYFSVGFIFGMVAMLFMLSIAGGNGDKGE